MNTIVKPAIAIDTPSDIELSESGPTSAAIGPAAIIGKVKNSFTRQTRQFDSIEAPSYPKAQSTTSPTWAGGERLAEEYRMN